MKRFPILLSVVLSLIALAVGLALFQQSRPVSSGELALPDGTTVRVVEVTYGTNHECGSLLARWVRHLPQTGQQWATAIFGTRNLAWAGYSGPGLVVWLRTVTNSAAPLNPPSRIIAWLCDESGFVSGEGAVALPWNQPFVGLVFSAAPRRDELLSVQFFGSYANGSTNLGSLRFKNPLYGNFRQWEPEKLPSTKQAGDVEVTLSEFATGLGPWTKLRKTAVGGRELLLDTNRHEGRNYCICVAQAHSLVSNEHRWHVSEVVLGDATGNRLEAHMKSTWHDDNGVSFEFEHGLWTNEQAWRLDFELSACLKKQQEARFMRVGGA